MDPDSEVYRRGNGGARRQRPPSSYGSMKTDSDVEEELMELPVEEDEEKKKKKKNKGNGGEAAMARPELSPAARPAPETHSGTRSQMFRSGSPETVFTSTTMNTKPPGAVVIDTRPSNGRGYAEDSEEEMDEDFVTHSPEPPELVLPEERTQTNESSQSGRLHPEQQLPHTFKAIQDILTSFTSEDLYKFKLRFCQWERSLSPRQLMEGDLLDFVDKIHEVLGQDGALLRTISTLEAVNKKEDAARLQKQCQRAWSRLHMKQHLIKKHKVIREGIVRPGKQNLLDAVYVEPQITARVFPTQQPRPQLPSPPPQLPGSDALVSVNGLFRLRRDDGQPVRTVLTTGLPGVGLSVCVGKFSLDWAEECANKDTQVVIQLPLGSLWALRCKNTSLEMSVVDLVDHFYPECRGMNFLDQANCKFLLILDSFDQYQATLDWKAPAVRDSHTRARLDVLIVNMIRGSVLPNACVWILGRAAAVSQIPAHFIDAVTEIHGFSDQMKDEYLTKRFHDATGSSIVAHYKRLPMLAVLAQHPFVCWMVATVFERCFMYQDYGVHPPRLTPFYVSVLVIQTNRRLQFYQGKGRTDSNQPWSGEDKKLLTNMGRMAFKMLHLNNDVFFEEDMREFSLKLTEVTVQSGLCTEVPATAPGGRRRFCFIHPTFREFLAALYAFTMLYVDSQNVLSPGRKALAADLMQSALDWTLQSTPGPGNMFLRFLCGLFSPECHVSQLSMCLLGCKDVKLQGREQVQQLLQRRIQSVQGEDRVANLRECLREMTQTDE